MARGALRPWPSYVDAPALPAELATEPWSEAAARWRLGELAGDLPVRVPADATFVGGNANDAWFVGDLVLRVCWRADRARLLREARLLEALPDSVPHASVVASGAARGMSWVLSPTLPGRPFGAVRGTFSAADQRGIMRDAAGIVRALHAWSPPPDIRAMLHDRPGLDLDAPMSVWAADQVPLPLPRLLAIVPLAKQVPGVDAALVDAAVGRIRELAEHDPFATGPAAEWCVVHGDTTVANLLVHEGRITALIDFEHARLGPRDLELLSPVLYGGGYGLDVWREVYPELFAGAAVRERIWLYELCCAVRGLVWWPPPPGYAAGGAQHPPFATLRRLVDAPSPW